MMPLESILVVTVGLLCASGIAVPAFYVGMRRALRHHEAARVRWEQGGAPTGRGERPPVILDHGSSRARRDDRPAR